jgi:hypothetical protein
VVAKILLKANMNLINPLHTRKAVRDWTKRDRKTSKSPQQDSKFRKVSYKDSLPKELRNYLNEIEISYDG